MQSVMLGMIVPGILLSTASRVVEEPLKTEPTTEATQPTEPTEPEEPHLISVILPNGERESMELEEYISRVVLGEVPADFDIEALKAQAIAARTYTLRCVRLEDKHSGGVCTDYRCCQAYKDPREYVENGGTGNNLAKVYYAVAQTKGEVLRYEGELICATYFANAGGSTEDAQAVWGQPYPYLKVVSSPEGEDSAYYSDSCSFTLEEFQSLLGETLTGKTDSWFGNISKTPGGGVDTIRIGGKFYTGIEVRSMFSLRSTIFTVTVTEDTVTFYTKGYGHRVGMSQYGAQAMAQQDSTCEEILAHYYPGTSLEQYD